MRFARPVVVRVPGSSANLGPGFDAVGLALGFHDLVEVTAVPGSGAQVEVTGEGAGRVGQGESHLVVRSIRAALERVGAYPPGLRLRCRNGVPFGRGIGSSAAAVVTGVVAARGLLAEPQRLDDDVALQVASLIEGHPDNAAASLLGGLTLGWIDQGRPRAVRIEPNPRIQAVVALPGGELSTAKARAMLPELVPHGDASFNASRSALLVEAITRRPDLLLAGTEDRLHQNYRAPAMPATAALIAALREEGLAATVSGAGPSVLVLADRSEEPLARVQRICADQWQVHAVEIDPDGAVVRDGAFDSGQ